MLLYMLQEMGKLQEISHHDPPKNLGVRRDEKMWDSTPKPRVPHSKFRLTVGLLGGERE